jgi:hypothetical protein
MADDGGDDTVTAVMVGTKEIILYATGPRRKDESVPGSNGPVLAEQLDGHWGGRNASLVRVRSPEKSFLTEKSRGNRGRDLTSYL